MANTYTKIYIHAVFAVKNRASLIDCSWRKRLYQYIASIIENHGHKIMTIGGTADHVHILFGLCRPAQALSDIMQQIKGGSSQWINRKQFTVGRFEWQSGYGAFTCSKNDISDIAAYIEKQEEHHNKWSLVEEYQKILNEFDIEYEDRFIFHSVD